MIYHNPIIADADWLGVSTIRVTFTSNWSMLHQLYAGRRLIGQTRSVTQRVIEASLTPTRWPQLLTVCAVSGANRGVDNGAALPPGPYNVVRLTWDQSTWSGSAHQIDCQAFDFFRGTVPEGAVDYDTIRKTVLASSAASPSYELFTDPLPGSGSWNLAIRGRDDSDFGGNAGTEDEVQVDVTAIPPDFDEDFTTSVSGGTLTVNCTLPMRNV